MFGFDLYNAYSIIPSLAIVAAMIVMSGLGIRFIRKEIAKDGAKAAAQ